MLREMEASTGIVSQSLQMAFCIRAGPQARPCEQRRDGLIEGRIESSGRGEALDESDSEGLLGINPPTGHHQVPRPPGADQPGQQGRFDHRRDTHMHFRHGEVRLLRGHTQIAACGDFDARTEAIALDPRHDGNRGATDCPKQGRAIPR